MKFILKSMKSAQVTNQRPEKKTGIQQSVTKSMNALLCNERFAQTCRNGYKANQKNSLVSGTP